MRTAALRAGLLSTLLALGAAPLAYAQGTPLPEAQARARLEAFNGELERAAKVLQGSFGKDPAAERERVEQAARIAAGIEQALTADLASAGGALDTVKANLAALKAEIERARLAQRYSAAEAAVRARHASGQAASDAEWQALSDALAALEAQANEGWKTTVAHFSARKARLEADRAALASAAAPAAPAAPAPAAAPSDALLEAFRAANKERRNLERLLEESEEPLPAEALASHLEAAARVSALSERAGRYYTSAHRHFLVANAFRQPDEEAFTTLPNLYQGELVAHGSARGKLKAQIAAEGGFCYALVGRFSRFGGDESVTDLKWSPQKKGVGLSRFDVPHAGPGFQLTQGVCVGQSTRLTLSATLEGAARDNPFRYVIVGWPETRLPPFVVAYMRVLDEDRCDDDAWLHAWTRPVPGALVYRGQEPWLVVDAARPSSDQLTLVNVSGARATVSKSEVTSLPPAERAFTTRFSFEGCPALTGAGSPEADRLAKCLARVEKKYAKSIEREEGWVARAKTDSAREKAEARLAALKERWERERAQQCDPLEQRLGERLRRTFERILDHHAENAISAPFDRVDHLRAEQEALVDLR